MVTPLVCDLTDPGSSPGEVNDELFHRGISVYLSYCKNLRVPGGELNVTHCSRVVLGSTVKISP